MQKIGLFLLAAAFSVAAHAQIQTLALTSTAPSTGACFAQNWVEQSPGSSDWKIQGASGFLSVSGSTVSAGSSGDVFFITNNTGTAGQIQDQSTTPKLYLVPSSTSSTGLAASSTPFTWDFLQASSCPQSAPPAPPSAPSTPSAPAPPATTPSGTVTIMPVGDSETWGLDTTAAEQQGGYRCAFYWNAFAASGVPINMVGSSQTIPNETDTPVASTIVANTFPGCPANAQGWSGYGGTTISQMVSGGLVAGTNNYTYPGGLEDVAKFQPDIIIFQGGTNDIVLGPESVNVTGDLTAALNAMFQADPKALIVVASIPPFIPSGDAVQSYYVTNQPIVNAQIAAVVASFQAAGRNVMLDTSYIGVAPTVANFPDDCCHPSASLYIQHANALGGELSGFIRAIASSASPEEQMAAVQAKVRTAVTLKAMVTAHPASN
jgi:lysophospholipase L1-like esterase